MQIKALVAGLLAGVSIAAAANAADLSIVLGDTGSGLKFLQSQVDRYMAANPEDKVTIVPMPSSTTDQFGQYRLWLAAGNTDIDVYTTDVIWAPQLADQFLDLTDAMKDIVGDYFPAIIESQTAKGKLVALPSFTDAPALFYRKDLLDKYKQPVPKTWDEMAATAKIVMDGERAAGTKGMWGFVFQGNSYEGLTCDALEWVKSSGGGQIIEADGKISINNPNAAAALERAKGWVGTISPPGVLTYQEEEARGVWQLGNAVFMRNWPYAYGLGAAEDSPIKGKFDVTTLPAATANDHSAATLGGWNLAVSKYSKNPDAAIRLVRFLSSADEQKRRAIEQTNLPTRIATYDDPDVAAAAPIIPRWKDVFQNAVPRPSAPAGAKYNEVSSLFWNAVHETLSGNGSAADNLAGLEADLTDLMAK
jgi:trehalose/maltose transport system substrate-binding protein